MCMHVWEVKTALAPEVPQAFIQKKLDGSPHKVNIL